MLGLCLLSLFESADCKLAAIFFFFLTLLKFETTIFSSKGGVGGRWGGDRNVPIIEVIYFILPAYILIIIPSTCDYCRSAALS